MISITSYLVISFILFVCGIIVMMARKNIIAILLGVELILNSSALTFVTYSKFSNTNPDGHIFALFIIIIAAAEAAVGLAIAIRFFQTKNSIHVDDASTLLN